MYNLYVLLLLLTFCRVNGQHGRDEYINTVNGKLKIEKLNFSLTHEHIMSNFGAPPGAVSVYDSAALFKQVIPYLKKIKSLGVTSIFDCTAAYFGRNVSLLKSIADSSGLQIITNTGFYGAAKDKYIPEFAFTQTAEKIASTWIAEFENGIDKTCIRPGFIKLGFDEGEPSAIDCKLFEAGIITHLKTGLTLVVHTGNNVLAAKEQLRLLKNKKVSPAAWVWAHANKVDDLEVLIDAALKGAWISLDGVNELNITEYINKIEAFRTKNLLHRILLSHDGNSFPRGAEIRKYEAISSRLIPELIKFGYTNEEINQLMVKNPKKAFRIKVRNSK